MNYLSYVYLCLESQDIVVPQEYTTYFRSVIVFGRASVIDQEGEIRSAIEKLAIKYYPDDSKDNRISAIEKEYKAMCMVKIQIEHMTGKEAIELVNAHSKRRCLSALICEIRKLRSCLSLQKPEKGIIDLIGMSAVDFNDLIKLHLEKGRDVV